MDQWIKLNTWLSGGKAKLTHTFGSRLTNRQYSCAYSSFRKSSNRSINFYVGLKRKISSSRCSKGSTMAQILPIRNMEVRQSEQRQILRANVSQVYYWKGYSSKNIGENFFNMRSK